MWNIYVVSKKNRSKEASNDSSMQHALVEIILKCVGSIWESFYSTGTKEYPIIMAFSKNKIIQHSTGQRSSQIPSN